MVTLPGLAAADAIWLASSLRGLAEAVSLDRGAPHAIAVDRTTAELARLPR